MFLESQGIEAKVFGDNNAFETGFSFTPASAPGLFVHARDVGRASELLEQFFDQTEQPPSGAWICPCCGESVEESFDICWNCESPRGERSETAIPTHQESITTSEKETSDSDKRSVSVPTSTENVALKRKERLVEVIVVTLLSSMTYLGSAAVRFLLSVDSFWGVCAVYGWNILIYTAVLSLVVHYVHRGGEQWRDFGVKRRAVMFDLCCGLLIFGLISVLVFFALDLAMSIWPPYEVRDFVRTRPIFSRPFGRTEITIWGFATLYAAVVEEVSMRGFVLTILKQATISWPKAIVVGSLLSLIYHVGFGWGPLLTSLLFCLVFSVLFWLGRRLWPILVAHLIMNAVVILQTG